MALVWEDYLKNAKNALTENRNKAHTDNTALYDNQVSTLNEAYDGQITEASKAYEDSYRENAIQKLINERQVAESMANMGLTDSGLNRTQQTAVQLSYANNKAALDRQKQSQIDALSRERASGLAGIEQKRLAAAMDIDNQYDKLAMENATAAYNADVEAETERQKNYYNYLQQQYEAQLKAEKEASYIIKTNGGLLSREFEGSLKDNGINVRYNSNGTTTYTDNNSGKSSTFESSINPYTGNNNATENSDTAKAWGEYGCFDNGYQPKGVYHNGKYYGYVSSSGMKDMINGNMQNVHKTKDGTLWIWDGKKNKYLVYEE